MKAKILVTIATMALIGVGCGKANTNAQNPQLLQQPVVAGMPGATGQCVPITTQIPITSNAVSIDKGFINGGFMVGQIALDPRLNIMQTSPDTMPDPTGSQDASDAKLIMNSTCPFNTPQGITCVNASINGTIALNPAFLQVLQTKISMPISQVCVKGGSFNFASLDRTSGVIAGGYNKLILDTNAGQIPLHLFVTNGNGIN